jgi:hypothetical protein
MENDESKFKDIVDFADEMRKELEVKYKDRPVEEFLIWLRIGLEREAMVAKAYSREYVTPEVKKLNMSPNLEKLVIQSILAAWNQESTHEEYARNAIEIVDPATNILEIMDTACRTIMGKIQASIITGLMSKDKLRNIKAKIAITLGMAVTEVPTFIKDLKTGSFRDFCLMNMALEQTAISGYKRMNDLLLKIAFDATHPYSHTTFIHDFGKIYNEEKYHYHLFKYYSNFPPSEDHSTDPITVPPDDGSSGLSLENAYRESAAVRIKKEIIALQNQTLGVHSSRLYRKLVVDVEKLKKDTFVLYMRAYFLAMSNNPENFSPTEFNLEWKKLSGKFSSVVNEEKVIVEGEKQIQRTMMRH